MIPLSVLDLSPVTTATPGSAALRNSLDLARLADRLGYKRYWLAEHHNLASIASSAPEIMIGRIAAATTTIGIQWGIFFALFAAIFLTCQGLRMRAAHVREPALAEDPTVPREVRRTSSYDQGLAASAADDLRRAREERRRAREADGG